MGQTIVGTRLPQSVLPESAAPLVADGHVPQTVRLLQQSVSHLTPEETERFLSIVFKTTRIKRHVELFHLMRGDVQHFIPHDILIAAWGDFRVGKPKLDAISAIPGIRTAALSDCNAEFVRILYGRWQAQGRRPLLVDNLREENLLRSGCGCVLHRTLQRMHSVLVHGFYDERGGSASLYLAANADAIVRRERAARIELLADAVIAQIDVAFRRVAEFKARGLAADPVSMSGCRVLSSREREILTWVAEGKTNQEISGILAISSFTVKNHVQRIIKKLGAGNRTEAAAKYRHQESPH